MRTRRTPSLERRRMTMITRSRRAERGRMSDPAPLLDEGRVTFFVHSLFDRNKCSFCDQLKDQLKARGWLSDGAGRTPVFGASAPDFSLAPALDS